VRRKKDDEHGPFRQETRKPIYYHTGPGMKVKGRGPAQRCIAFRWKPNNALIATSARKKSGLADDLSRSLLGTSCLTHGPGPVLAQAGDIRSVDITIDGLCAITFVSEFNCFLIRPHDFLSVFHFVNSIWDKRAYAPEFQNTNPHFISLCVLGACL
jgi:hypothetical protein